MKKHIHIFIKDVLIAILHCDMFKAIKVGDFYLIDLYKLEYDSDYEIQYWMFIGNITCDSYEVKEV